MNRTAAFAAPAAAFQPLRRLGQRGVSLVESAIVLCIAAVAAGAAAPSFERALQRRHLEGAAAQLATDLQHARSAAVARNAPVRITFEQQRGTSCYVVHTGAAGDCRCAASGAAVCRAGAEALHTVRFDAGAAVQVASNSPSMAFDPHKGTVTPTGTARIVARDGSALHAVVNVMGRVRACSPGATTPGYKAC